MKKNVSEAKRRKDLYEDLSNMPHITYASIKSQLLLSKDSTYLHGSYFRSQYFFKRNLTTPRDWIWILAALCKDFVYCLFDENIINDKNFTEVYKKLKKLSPDAFLTDQPEDSDIITK